MCRTGRSVETERKLVQPRAGVGWVGAWANWGLYRFWGGGNKDILKMIVVMFVQICEYTKRHQIVHFKGIHLNCIF